VSLPDRFHPEVRLGRDRDSEVWLATDTALDRPVLARIVGPSAGTERRTAFAAGVRAAAAVTHDHLAAVYAADNGPDTAYAVTEWAGGVTIQDRIAAGEPIPLDDFLPNASGLADALAKLHAAGVVHGAIAPDAVLYSAAHPAKLSPFATMQGDAKSDTAALAATLVAGLAGGATDVAPSQLAEGLPRSVDGALRAARTGKIDAAGLAAALRSAPSPAAPPPRPEWNWRWVGVAGGLLAIALVVIVLGFALDASSDSALLFPVGQATPPPTPAATTPTTVVPPGAPGPVQQPEVTAVGAFDPFGDGAERDEDIALVLDGEAATAWRTERYFDPLQLIKPGVGIVFASQGSISQIIIEGSAGTAIAVGWAEQPVDSFEEWSLSTLATTTVLGSGPTAVAVPPRDGGAWLLWLTDLPAQEGGEYFYATIAEVRFAS
jgi:hypothetical protein